MPGKTRLTVLGGTVLLAATWGADRTPTSEEQERFLEATRGRALAYARSLPDFICMQRVRRFSNERAESVFTIRLSYSSHGEKYSLVELNGVATNLPYEALRGPTSQGEFGSLLVGIMAPESGAKFQFERWSSLGRQRVAVYSHRTPSGYRLRFYDEGTGKTSRALAGQEGELLIETESKAILRVTSTATSIPEGFRIRSAVTTVSYDYREIGGRRYLLPVTAETSMTIGRVSSRSQIEFLNYQKFSSDTVVRFEQTDSDGDESGKR
jgi:hypothetical protein